MRAAASRSSRFVYDSSLPCRMLAAPRPAGWPTRRRDRRTRRPAGADFRRSADRESSRTTASSRFAERCWYGVPLELVARQGDARQRRRRSRCRTRRCARTPCASARSGTRALGPASICAKQRAGSRADRRRPARRGSSWPRRAPCSDRRCRSARPARRSSTSRSRRGLLERIEVDDDDVDRRDAVRARPPRGRRDGRAARGCRRGRPDAGSSRGRPSSRESRSIADTLVTARPASLSARAVPPVETSSKPRAARPRPRSTMPVLSETLSRALGIMREVQYYHRGRRAGLAPEGKGRSTAAFFFARSRA